MLARLSFDTLRHLIAWNKVQYTVLYFSVLWKYLGFPWDEYSVTNV